MPLCTSASTCGLMFLADDVVDRIATSALVRRRKRAGLPSILMRSLRPSPSTTPRSLPALSGAMSVAPTTCRPSVSRTRRAMPAPIGPRPQSTTRVPRAIRLALHLEGRDLLLGLGGQDHGGRDRQEAGIGLAADLDQDLEEAFRGDAHQLALGALRAENFVVDLDRPFALDHRSPLSPLSPVTGSAGSGARSPAPPRRRRGSG